jgi:hypothetical protein
MVKNILKQREQSEFDKALNTVTESLEMAADHQTDPQLAEFYQKRMRAMQSFFKTLDSLVSAALALEGLVSLSTLKTMMEKVQK